MLKNKIYLDLFFGGGTSNAVWEVLFTLGGGVRVTRSQRFISGATPLLVYVANIVADRFPHMRVSAEVNILFIHRHVLYFRINPNAMEETTIDLDIFT